MIMALEVYSELRAYFYAFISFLYRMFEAFYEYIYLVCNDKKNAGLQRQAMQGDSMRVV
jgi:hypothetical protein